MVCALDVHEPFADITVPQARRGGTYRSVLIVATLDGDPFGTAVIATDGECKVPRARVATEVRRQLRRQMTRLIARRARHRDAPPAATARRSVSVVITTCRNAENLNRCLTAVLASDHKDFEVIVVENRPGPGDTRTMVKERFGSDLRVRYLEERQRGLSSARNAGLAAAAKELVAFLDDDVVVDRSWMRRAALAFERSDEVACVTGLILPLELETESQLLLERFMTLGKGFTPRIFQLPDSWDEYPALPYTPGVVGSGANTIVRADVAWQLGPFDPSLGTGTPAAGGEDLDLYIRLLRAGHAIAYEPGAIVWHPHPSEPAQLRRQVYRYGIGLGATLAKQLIAGPDRRQLLQAIPAGVAYARDPRSRKNAGTADRYPQRLRWLERVGMLLGPLAYIASAARSPGRHRPRPRKRTTASGRRLSLNRLTLDGGSAVEVVEVTGTAAVPSRRTRSGARVPRGARSARPPAVDRAALTALFGLSVVVFAAARATGTPGLALAAALAILFFGVGTAPLQLRADVDLSVRLGVAGLVGLVTALLAGTVMVLGPLWHPELAAALALAVAALVHAAAWPAAGDELERWRARHRPMWPPRRISASLAFTLAGTSLWLGCAIGTAHVVPGIGGFLTQITPLWYAGVLLVLVGITLAWGEPHQRYALIAVTSLVLALTLTPALVYGMPRSQSAAKHIALIQLILGAHHLHSGDGIYFAYSGFFAAIAWLCRIAGVSDPLGLATFWPMTIGLVRLAGLSFLFGQAIPGRHRRWVAIALVVLVDAIGSDYFSPQSVGYVIGLGVYGLAVSSPEVLGSRFVATLLIASGLALAPAHELSPYIIGGVLVVLALFRCARPRWAGLAILVPAGLWALVNHGVLGGYFSLSSLGDLSNFAPPQTPTAPGLTRAPIVAISSYALTLGLLVLVVGALIGFVRNRRHPWAWAYLGSAGVGALLLIANPYGNEGIFRCSLFGIPWLALMAVYAVRRPSTLMRYAGWGMLSAGLLATFLLAEFGMDASGVMRRSDLEAWRAFAAAAPLNSDLLPIGFGDMPDDVPMKGPHPSLIPFQQLNDAASERPGRPRPADLSALLTRYEALGQRQTAGHAGALYAIWSPVLTWYEREYGLDRTSQSRRWLALLRASPSWRLIYARDGTYMFRAVTPPAATRGP